MAGWRDSDEPDVRTVRYHFRLPLRDRLRLRRLRLRLRLHRFRIWLRFGRPALDRLDDVDRRLELTVLYGLCPRCRSPREPVMSYRDGNLSYDLLCLGHCDRD